MLSEPPAAENKRLLSLPDSLDAAWLARTQAWVQGSQVNSGDIAAYGEIIDQLVESKPDLYVTAWFAQISALLGLPLPKGLVSWLQNLKQEDGSYRDPFGRFPPMVSTLFALSSLAAVGGEIEAADQTVEFLSDLQEPSGFYRMALNPADTGREEPLSARVTATLTALQIFQLLSVVPTHMAKTRELLLSLAADEALFSDDSRDSMLNEGGLVLDALRRAGVRPEALPSRSHLQTWIQRWVAKLSAETLDVGVATVILSERVVTLAEYLDVELPNYSALLDKIAGAQLQNGGFGLGGGQSSLEPQTTYRVIKLFHRGNRAYPRRGELAATLARYRTDQAWKTIIDLRPNLASTLYAVGFSTVLGFELPRAALKNYLMKAYEALPTDMPAPGAVIHLYQIARLYQLLGIPLPPSFKSSVESAVAALTISTDAVNAETLARAVTALDISAAAVSPDTAKRMCAFVTSLRNQDGGFGIPNEASDVNTTYYALVIANGVGNCNIRKQDAVRWLQSMQAPDGGFRTAERLPIANMDATFYATMGLLMSQAEPIDPRQVLKFVERAKHEPYGLSFLASDSPGMARYDGMPTNLKSTYEAVFLLGALAHKDVGIQWELPP